MKFRTPIFITLIAFALLTLVATPPAVPPGVATLITAAVSLVIALALHFGPLPSRLVTLVGFLASTFGLVGPRIIELLPAGPALVIVITGLVLMALNGRLQGTSPSEAVR